jgi:hypothetical protein
MRVWVAFALACLLYQAAWLTALFEPEYARLFSWRSWCTRSAVLAALTLLVWRVERRGRGR